MKELWKFEYIYVFIYSLYGYIVLQYFPKTNIFAFCQYALLFEFRLLQIYISMFLSIHVYQLELEVMRGLAKLEPSIFFPFDDLITITIRYLETQFPNISFHDTGMYWSGYRFSFHQEIQLKRHSVSLKRIMYIMQVLIQG